LLLPLVAADVGDFDLGATIKGLPGTVKNSLRQFKVGTGAMWVNSKEAGKVKKRVKAGGPLPSYGEQLLLRKSDEDTTKLIQAGVMWLAAPELIPAMLYFYPRALPSTFESSEGCMKRHATLCRLRASATLQLLAKLEEDSVARGKKGVRSRAQRQLAVKMLRSRSISSAMQPVSAFVGEPAIDPQKRKRKGKARASEALKGLPQPLLKTGCKLIGVSGPLPGPLRRGTLAGHLDQLVIEDEVLARTSLQSIPRELLIEACIDRAVASPACTDAQLRKHLGDWLSLVSPKAGDTTDPHRIRLAAMAGSAMISTRTAEEVALPRLLFMPSA